MTRVSIRPCHAYEYMVEQSGGYRRVIFTVKDLYNKIDQQRMTAPFESDSEGTLSYMNALTTKDPHFFCRFTTDSEDRMVGMFWQDGHSFVDYQCYEDVLIFDNTYKTNMRLWKLTLGCLEAVETDEAVITDGDEAMYTAIQTVMLEARHRLCIWHIGQNANGHLKSAEKLKAFNRCIRKYQMVEQFDRLWQDMLDEFDLHDNDWINSMYEKRDKFCQAFFRDIFMAGMRSTQRCDGMNKDFKLVLSKSKTLVQVVSLVDRTLMRIRNNQERDDFNNMNSFHSVKTHLEDLEKQASSVFTHDVFKCIFREIMKEAHITLKYGALTADCNRLCFYASKTQEGYNMLKMEIDRLASIMEGLVRKEHEKAKAWLGSDHPSSVATPAKRRGGDGRGEEETGEARQGGDGRVETRRRR
ncbi:hypothetical protein ACLB2K_016506 [Fragaria x ananassa]